MAPWTEKDRRPYDPTPDAGRGPADFRAEGGNDPDDRPRREEGRPADEARPRDEARSKDELYEEAKRLKIDGRSRMSREELLSAIRLASVARIPR